MFLFFCRFACGRPMYCAIATVPAKESSSSTSMPSMKVGLAGGSIEYRTTRPTSSTPKVSTASARSARCLL